MREIRVYLALTSSILLRPRSLFVSPRYPSRSFSKNALSFFLHQVIMDANALWEDTTPLAHNIRDVATSAAFLRNWSVSKVLRRRLGDLTQFSPHFILEIFRILWTIAAPLARSLLLASFVLNLFYVLF